MGIYSSNFVVSILATLASSVSCFFLIYFQILALNTTLINTANKNCSNKLVNFVN